MKSSRVDSRVRADPFVGYRFPSEVILLAVRWYLRYGCRIETSRNYSPNEVSRWITSRSTAGSSASLRC